ncbi:MAG TPA: hypothetical protein PK156_28515 [Polyangium sp.]|nr:hypothetical protein [Polyangium sp.]
MNRYFFAGAIYGFVATWSVLAAAEPAVVASTLFNQAVEKMEAEQFSEACPMLEQSYKLAPKPGTLFTLANCRDREGKIASANTRYAEYLRTYAGMTEAERQKHANRAFISETRVHELEPQLPILKLTWQGELPTHVKILVDDVEWVSHLSGFTLPLDPGPHRMSVIQRGAPGQNREIMLELGKMTTLDINAEVSFVKLHAPEPTTDVVPVKTLPSATNPRTNPRKTAGFITLGVGGAGFVFGGIMGILAISEKQTVAAHCHGTARYDCDATGISAVEKMRVYANPSTIGFVAGGVLAATGVVLVLTSPRQTKEEPMTMTLHAGGVRGGGFVGVEGKF